MLVVRTGRGGGQDLHLHPGTATPAQHQPNNHQSIKTKTERTKTTWQKTQHYSRSRQL
jgi:hypothetical protein